METNIVYATLAVYLIGSSDTKIISVDNVRLDYVELTDTYLKFRDLDDVWYVIPMDSLLYYTFKINND
jgi:hypothetical protein